MFNIYFNYKLQTIILDTKCSKSTTSRLTKMCFYFLDNTYGWKKKKKKEFPSDIFKIPRFSRASFWIKTFRFVIGVTIKQMRHFRRRYLIIIFQSL